MLPMDLLKAALAGCELCALETIKKCVSFGYNWWLLNKLRGLLSVSGSFCKGLPCLHFEERLVNISCLDKYPVLPRRLIKRTVEILIQIAALAIKFDRGESKLFLCCHHFLKKIGRSIKQFLFLYL